MRVLMVCLGNICRSPLAQGIMEKKLSQLGINWEVDSAGTSGWHIGESPDPRSQAKAAEYDIDISNQKGRQVSLHDLEYYDLILAMDSSNYRDIISLTSDKNHIDKIKLILNYVYPGRNMAVPDPYYDNGFQNVYELLEEAVSEVIDRHK